MDEFNAKQIVSIHLDKVEKLFEVFEEDFFVKEFFGLWKRNLGKILLSVDSKGKKFPIWTSDPFIALNKDNPIIWHNDKHKYFIEDSFLFKKARVKVYFSSSKNWRDHKSFRFKSDQEAIDFIQKIKESSGHPESFFTL